MLLFRKILPVLLLSFLIAPTCFAEVNETFSNQGVLKVAELSESYRAEGNVGVVVEGIGLLKKKKRKGGDILISSIPEGAVVKQAWLYWMGYLRDTTAEQLASMVFNGQIINANTSVPSVLIAEEDPTGAATVRQVYKADVSSFLHNGVNGKYSVVPSHKKKSNFAASMLVIYEHPSLGEGMVVIEDGLAMLSNEKASRIENGANYSSVIAGLSSLPISTARIVMGVSNGPARDKHSVTVSSSSSRATFTDVTKNSKGKALDHVELNLTELINSGEESVSIELENSNNRGSYSHYFFNVFEARVDEVDFSESSLEVSQLAGSPGEILDYTATLVNSASVVSGEVVFEVDVPDNADFVDGSLMYAGFSQTDTDDLDDAYYDEVNRLVVVEGSNIASGGSKEVNFQIQLLEDVTHSEEVATQGHIVAEGVQFLTDGDGNVLDGVDSETAIAVQGGKITDLPENFSVYLKNSPSIDPRYVDRTGINTVVFAVDDVPVAEIDLDLDSDLVIQNINAAAVQFADKAFFHGFQEMSGTTELSYTLLIPKNGSSSVRLCLGATSIDQIHLGCEESYEEVYAEHLFSNGETIDDITCTADSSFWRCSGVTGSGGQGEGGGGVPEFNVLTYVLALGGCYMFIILQRKNSLGVTC